MWRLFAIIAFILICYNYPSSYHYQYLELDNLKENTARSFYLCVAISLIWTTRAALSIIVIESVLIAANFYTAYHMPHGGILNGYYALLQQSAYWLELAIMTSFIVIEWRKSGKDRNSNIHSDMLHGRSNRNRAGGHN